jgi:uncharacterized membrane protein YebE (DUF533 family)
MNPQAVVEQFLGTSAPQRGGESARHGGSRQRLTDVAGGAAAGGVLGLLLGNKKARKKVGKLAGGVVGYGGAAALGALAHRAYTNWQAGGAAAPDPAPAMAASLPTNSPFLPASAPAADGRPFELALVLAMIAAANADGHIGAEEQSAIFERVGQLPLDAEDKAFVFDALATPPSLQDIAGMAAGQEQAAEVYLASRMAIDPDHPMEQAYLEALAHRLSLPADLVAHLERTAVETTG